jgi:hypothetical protein
MYEKIDLGYVADGHPFAMLFVYPKVGKPFIITGNVDKIDDYIQKFSSNIPCFWKYTYWKNGISRGHWLASHFYIFKKCKNNDNPYDPKGQKVWEITGKGKKFNLRRLPHKWIPEFDQFIQ